MNIMVVLIIFPVILQTVINVIMLSIRGQRAQGLVGTRTMFGPSYKTTVHPDNLLCKGTTHWCHSIVPKRPVCEQWCWFVTVPNSSGSLMANAVTMPRQMSSSKVTQSLSRDDTVVTDVTWWPSKFSWFQRMTSDLTDVWFFAAWKQCTRLPCDASLQYNAWTGAHQFWLTVRLIAVARYNRHWLTFAVAKTHTAHASGAKHTESLNKTGKSISKVIRWSRLPL